MQTAAEYVSGNRYPGRGILLGLLGNKNELPTTAVAAYFIMGRSTNSRNRVFVPEGSNLRTQAKDPSKMQDPSLVIYAPVRVFENQTIVTNGDQTDTIYAYLSHGGSFESALRTREFEPDPPNYTPRISGLLTVQNGTCAYKLSILKSLNGNPASCLRQFFEVANPVPGVGHIIHTYLRDGSPAIPSYAGDPTAVALHGTIEALAANLWHALDEENKIALFVRYIPLDGTEPQTKCINKY
jgi:hypothetical protein